MIVRAARRGPGNVIVRGLLALGVVTSVAVTPFACAVVNAIAPTTCDRSKAVNDLKLYTEGETVNGIYMTSDWDGELLYFPGGSRYLLRHGLGARPRSIELFLSFDQTGTDTGVISPAAGNQAEIRCVDKRDLVVVNGSCVDYWLLVTATAGSTDDEPDAGDEGAGGGGGGGDGGVEDIYCEERETVEPDN